MQRTLALRIPAGHVHFQFDYAGLSFIAPQKVRYRYMLEGFDRDWTEAGARRSAYYTNIPPGRYTFRVQAANNDGLWNTRALRSPSNCGRTSTRPLWFYALLLLAAGGPGGAGAAAAAARGQKREFHAVLGERNRIAREIHDTLAQGYVGISVQLEVLAELLRMNKVGGRGEAPGPDARLRARGPGRRAAVDLGAAFAGLGRDDAAGEAAAHGRGRRRRRDGGRLQPLRRLPAAAAGARSANSCAWPRRPSIM